MGLRPYLAVMNEFIQHWIHEFSLPLQNPVLVFSVILLVILLAPILLRGLRLPGIFGLILSGVLIGPHGLHVLEQNSAVQLFSTIGLLYIMFIAGLELDLADFKAHRNRSLVFGFFTFTIPIAVGYPVCSRFLGYDPVASLLISSMFATHTLMAYPIVSRLGISRNQAVAVAVGGTILTDTAVLIILAVVVGMNQGALDQSFWIKLGVSLAIFSAIIFGLIPHFARWFFRKLESEKHAHYIFVLAIVFFAAFLAEVAGVEPIIGAFAAGLALNPLIPHTSALMNRIEFMGNALFIPFFLISVGMIVDLSVIFEGVDAWVIALTLTAVALVSKWLAAAVTQLVFRFSGAQRQLLFGLSSAHAAATIAVIMVGFNEGILDEAVLNGTIILILITSLASTLATERAGKKIVKEGTDAPTNSTHEAPHVLVPNIRSDRTPALLELAMAMRTSSKSKPITVLSIVPNDEQAEGAMAQAHEHLRGLVRQGAAAEVQVQPHVTLDFNISSGVARTSRELQATTVVLDWIIKPSLVNSLLGESVSSIVEKIDRNVFLCRLIEPLVTVNRMVLLCPPLSERENGFEGWLHAVANLARQQNLEFLVVANTASYAAISSTLKSQKVSISGNHEAFDDWDDLLVATRLIRLGDMVVVASGRLGSPSYAPYMEALPGKLSKYLEHQNLIVIYPKPFGTLKGNDHGELMQGSPLTKGFETIEQLGKGLFGSSKS
jgi:Kef-type K+ transport system membrane component KefB